MRYSSALVFGKLAFDKIDNAIIIRSHEEAGNNRDNPGHNQRRNALSGRPYPTDRGIKQGEIGQLSLLHF